MLPRPARNTWFTTANVCTSNVRFLLVSLSQQGTIGRVIQVLGFGPHRLSAEERPAWFFEKARYGGILCDIGSHQIEQFLFYSGASDATVTSARVANYANKQYPELEDFGDATLVADNGATSYFRVDWLTPDGLRTWGDGRTFILGTDGYIEMRKYIDVSREAEGDHLFLVNKQGEQHFDAPRKGWLSLLWPADSGLPQCNGNRYDPGPRIQGGRTLPQGSVCRSTHRVATPIENFPPMGFPPLLVVLSKG